VGFGGQIAVTSHHGEDTVALLALGADLVVEPFQDAADRAVELLAGAEMEERIEIPRLQTEQQPSP
jgi:CO/xanthine dehydrogenase FAD-binding subunit